jgi:hypothetical protein
MNLFKKLIKNNWLRGYSEDTLSYDDLTIKLNENQKEKLEIFQDFLNLLKLAEANKIEGPPLFSFKNKCVLCALNPIKFNQEKECSNSNECILIRFFNECGDTSTGSPFSSFKNEKKDEKKEEKIRINFSLIDKIHKLSLNKDKKNNFLSLSVDHFIEWLENEQLTENDFNYLFADPLIIRYPEIMKAAEIRKKELTRKTKPKKRKNSIFLDKEGKSTWYIKNISPNHIIISDIDITIKRGRVLDLLRETTAKQIEKSRDFKQQIEIGNLKRLTEKEYIIELEKHRTRYPIKPGMKELSE